MMKKVLVFTSWGSHIPKIVADKMKEIGKPFPQARYGEIIEAIENIAIDYDETIHTLEFLKNNPDILVCKDNSYMGRAQSDKHMIAIVEIVTIDTDKRWLIDEYDGAEGIIEVPEYKCIDPEINLYAPIQK